MAAVSARFILYEEQIGAMYRVEFNERIARWISLNTSKWTSYDIDPTDDKEKNNLIRYACVKTNSLYDGALVFSTVFKRNSV